MKLLKKLLTILLATSGAPVVAKVLKKTLTTSATVVGALFVVYFWNLDQKLMGWLYKQVNTMFDRKPTDIKF